MRSHSHCQELGLQYTCLEAHGSTQNRHMETLIDISSKGFPGGSGGKESACNAGDPGLIPGLGRSLGEENGNPLQGSCLGNPMDGGARQAIVDVRPN